MWTRETDADATEMLLGRLKSHLRITANDLDDELGGKLLAAVEAAEHRIGRVILLSTFTDTIAFDSSINLQRPLVSVVSAEVDGSAIALANCSIDTLAGTITFPDGTEGSAVNVTYKAGMQQIPADIIHAIMLFAASLFANPMDTVENLPRASARLLRPYRNYGL